MNDEELSTMLTKVLDEFEARAECPGWHQMRAIADKLRPKRVYVWVGSEQQNGVSIWAWSYMAHEWLLYSPCAFSAGTIFADHKPESTDLAVLKPIRVDVLPAGWRCVS